MRAEYVIAVAVAFFSAAFITKTTADSAKPAPAAVKSVSEVTQQSAARSEGVKVDTKAAEKPIRVILPSPYETASR